MDRHRHVLPFAAAVAVDQCGDDAGRHLLAGDVVGVPDLGSNGRQVVVAARFGVVPAVHHRPTEGEVDEIGSAVVGPRPGVAKW